jgi:hypothetical protein
MDVHAKKHLKSKYYYTLKHPLRQQLTTIKELEANKGTIST